MTYDAPMNTPLKLKFLITAAALVVQAFAATGAVAAPSEVIGKVVYVDDGDTVVLLVDGRSQMKVRLSSIDAPESSHTNKESGRVGQPFSEGSKKALAAMVHGKVVTARCFETDRYERSVCELFESGVSVNQRMVAQGWAWANQSYGGKYLRDRGLLQTEAQARTARIGLWAGNRPIPPWDWRKACWEQGQCNSGN